MIFIWYYINISGQKPNSTGRKLTSILGPVQEPQQVFVELNFTIIQNVYITHTYIYIYIYIYATFVIQN